MTFGPWSPTCDRIERGKQLRSLQAILACHHGSDHPLIARLRAAERDAMAYVDALTEFEQLPPLHRRRVLTTFSMITWPR
jgi:hypothetical protein